MVYFDNKRRFSYDIFKGSPGSLRVKILPEIQTSQLTMADIDELKQFTYSLIYNELMNDQLGKEF